MALRAVQLFLTSLQTNLITLLFSGLILFAAGVQHLVNPGNSLFAAIAAMVGFTGQGVLYLAMLVGIGVLLTGLGQLIAVWTRIW